MSKSEPISLAKQAFELGNRSIMKLRNHPVLKFLVPKTIVKELERSKRRALKAESALPLPRAILAWMEACNEVILVNRRLRQNALARLVIRGNEVLSIEKAVSKAKREFERSEKLDSSKPRIDRSSRLRELLPILRCPLTGGALEVVDAVSLKTIQSGSFWPILDGTPVLFPEMCDPVIKSDLHISNQLSASAEERIAKAKGWVLNLSAGGTSRWYSKVVEVEAARFRNTDVIADAHRLPFADGVFDLVVAFNAFEHYAEPHNVAREILRVLKPGGHVQIHTAFLQPLHEPPWHFYDCTKFGLLKWFEKFEKPVVTVTENFSPGFSVGWLTSDLERLIREEHGDDCADGFMSSSISSFVRYWREPENRGDKVWRSIATLSQGAQERVAAGFQLVAHKLGSLDLDSDSIDYGVPFSLPANSQFEDDFEQPRPRRAERVAQLLPILRCPITGEKLKLGNGGVLQSTETGHRWPMVKGAPVLFPGMSEPVSKLESHISNQLSPEAEERIANSAGWVLNLSAGGTVRWSSKVVEAEAARFRNTDVIADAHNLPFADNVFDLVVAYNAFEHYSEPHTVAKEILRVLRPGGCVQIHTAFLQPLHEPPWHFFDCTKFGLLKWFEHFERPEVTVTENFSPAYSLAWIASDLERLLRGEQGSDVADAFLACELSRFASYWRNPRERDDKLWRNIASLSQEAQEHVAAGFQLVATKSKK